MLRPQDERPDAIVGNAVDAAREWVRCLTWAACHLLNLPESVDRSPGMVCWMLHAATHSQPG